MTEPVAGAQSHRAQLRFAVPCCARMFAWAAVGLLFAFGGPGGCGILSLATLGTVASAAAPAVSAGQELYSMGKLDTAEMQRANDVALAARKAALDLGLRRRPNPNERGVRDLSLQELEFVDQKGNSFKVTIDRRAERLVLLRIDVGLFGSQPAARLFLTRIRAHLPDTVLRGPRSGG